MTPFAALCRLAGLSIREASEFLDVPTNTANKWAQGSRNAPPGVMGELRSLVERQETAAAEALDLIDRQRQSGIVELGYPSDDHEARSLGWPCVGAWGAVAARIIAGTDAPITLVPRGSTPATARAADEREISN